VVTANESEFSCSIIEPSALTRALRHNYPVYI